MFCAMTETRQRPAGGDAKKVVEPSLMVTNCCRNHLRNGSSQIISLCVLNWTLRCEPAPCFACFTSHSFHPVLPVFHRYYHSPTLANRSTEVFPQGGDLLGGNRSEVVAGLALNALPESFIQCTRERPVLCLLLMLGTLWMGYTLYQFKRRYVYGMRHCGAAALTED